LVGGADAAVPGAATYLSLVWRSRLLNESRLRSASAGTTDPLTGLSTSSVLIERLMRVMSRAHQSSDVTALFLIEVKNWQGLLKELGAEFNEKMLLEAALRLRRSIGDNDLVARIAGGRFAVVAQDLRNEAEINALATRLVVSGLRIDSPLLPGVEFQFRVIVSNLKSSRPLGLAATEAWLTGLAGHFEQWPGSHRSRSILLIAADQTDIGNMADGPKIDSDY
jgi:diguanylate cyclase (GGDEF)-like protein